ncbi:MAG TPA: tetratricopeptide repeat protein [Pseudomonadota bacterium]|nr:tetratricopeptide repeat protein [Pseudomonadota bacterium]
MDKTQPKSAAPSQPKSKPVPVATGSARPFLLRKRNSSQVLRCPDLLTLRQWIAEKRLTRDDEVSRTGQKWRKMGTIVEFESLFYGVDQERLAKRKATEKDAAVIPISSAAKKGVAPTPADAKTDAKTDAKIGVKADAKPAAKTEASASEKPVLGPLKVTPPGLNQVSGNLSLMRLARPGSGKAKPAPTPPGLSGSAAAAKRAQDGGKTADSAAVPTAVATADTARNATAKTPAKTASPTTSDSQTAVYKRSGTDELADNDETRRIEPSDETRRIEPSDETRRIERDPKTTAKTKPADPIEEAIKKSDPVPRALQEARDVTQKIPASEPDEYELIERQAARRRNGILLLVAGGAALGLYYLLGSDQPTPQPTTQPVAEQKVTAPTTTPPKPVVEPLPTSNPPTATAPTATAPTATAPTANANAAPVGPAPAPTVAPPAAKPAVAPVAAAPVGPAPAPTAAAKPAPTVAPAPTATPTAPTTTAAAKPTPTVTPLPPTAAAKPQVPAPAAPTAVAKPAPTPAATAPAAATPAAATPAAGTKITSDEVRRITGEEIPKTFDGQIELANKYFERGKYDQALAVYQLMMTYAPNVPAIHKALGDIAFERNQADTALSHYNDSLQIRPSYSAAEFGLAKTYHRLKNDKDQAISHYTKYLELNPKGSAAAACRDGITKLGGTPPAPPPAGP